MHTHWLAQSIVLWIELFKTRKRTVCVSLMSCPFCMSSQEDINLLHNMLEGCKNPYHCPLCLNISWSFSTFHLNLCLHCCHCVSSSSLLLISHDSALESLYRMSFCLLSSCWLYSAHCIVSGMKFIIFKYEQPLSPCVPLVLLWHTLFDACASIVDFVNIPYLLESKTKFFP